MTGVMDMVTAARAEIENLNPAEAARELARGDVLLIDVREPAETVAGMIPGAVSAPRGTLEFLADPASAGHVRPFHPAQRVIVYSGTGRRSALAARTLQDLGYPDVAHMEGGFAAWCESGHPVAGLSVL